MDDPANKVAETTNDAATKIHGTNIISDIFLSVIMHTNSGLLPCGHSLVRGDHSFLRATREVPAKDMYGRQRPGYQL